MARVKLNISKDLDLPESTATQKLAWIGTTGSGKTYGASKLAEQFWVQGAQFVTLDPVGVWWGLRLAKDGKKPSKIDIPIFGGLHGDVPLESTSGELLANLVVDKGISCVIDVSQFESDADKTRFATDFANRFFFRKKAAPSAVHLFLEECQEFVPQNPQRGEERMLHAFTRMQKLGRNFGIGSSYISQRPQEVNKKALNMAQTLFVFRTTGTHERNAIEKWIEDKSLDESIAQDLPKIPTGECHVWSPEFLKISSMAKISEKETFNASATPEVGAAPKARQLADIDINKIRSDMAATIEKAKADDPKELKKKIAELERGVKTPAPAAAGPMGVSQWMEYGRKYKYDEFFESRIRAEEQKKFEIERSKIRKFFADLEPHVKSLLAMYSKPMSPVRISAMPHSPKKFEPQKQESSSPARVPEQDQNPSELGSTEQKVLDAIAFMESIGVERPAKAAVAFVAGYSPVSSGYQNSCGKLRSMGFVIYPEGAIAFTEKGRAYAKAPEGYVSNEDLHEKILEKLPTTERAILKALIEIRAPIHKEELATRLERSWTASGFQNACGRLRSLGLVKYPGPNMIEVEEILFPRQ